MPVKRTGATLQVRTVSVVNSYEATSDAVWRGEERQKERQ